MSEDFEIPNADVMVVRDNDLTKREQFAMAAMQGVLASDYYSDFCSEIVTASNRQHQLAKWVVGQADALIKELEK